MSMVPVDNVVKIQIDRAVSKTKLNIQNTVRRTVSRKADVFVVPPGGEGRDGGVVEGRVTF